MKKPKIPGAKLRIVESPIQVQQSHKIRETFQVDCKSETLSKNKRSALAQRQIHHDFLNDKIKQTMSNHSL